MLWVDFIPLAAQCTCMGAGLLLIRLGTRTQSNLPHCAACKFDLSAHGFEFNRGLGKVVAAPGSEESDRAVCPECGTRLTPYDSVRFVLRRFNWKLCGPGLALVFLPFAVMLYATTRGPAAPMVVMNAPESLVIRLGENELDHRYIDELLRRIRAGELSSTARDALALRTIARAKQPTRMSERYNFTEQLLGALIDAGAITPADLASILGEPRVSLHLASRTYRDWAPIVRASAVVDTPNIPDRMTISVENLAAYLTDVLDTRGQMTQWEVIDGSARAGGMSDGIDTSSGGRVFSLRAIDADAHGTFKSELGWRDYDISADIVISRNGVELFRRRASTSGQQQVIDAGEPLIVLDMDPATNAAARACYDGMWAAFSPPNGQPRAHLLVYWPHSLGGPMRLYRVTVRPAGRPESPPMIDEVLVAPGMERINGTHFYRLRTKAVVDADFTAVDVHFEPDVAAANKRYDGLTHTSIAGEAFTILDVPVK